MLAISLRHARTRLQAHRQWLQRFVAASRSISSCAGDRSSPLTASLRLTHGPFKQPEVPLVLRRCASRKLKSQRHRLRAETEAVKAAETDTQHRTALLAATTEVDIDQVIDLYPICLARNQLDQKLTGRIFQCLHEAGRREKRDASNPAHIQRMERLLAFARQLSTAVKDRRLEPNRRGFLHLLSFYKESGARAEGVAFWEWLRDQDDMYVDSDVYGAAIELLAVDGAPLTELETLYEEALERFPGNFNAYHLTHNAILADREEPTNILGIPMTLLQGIFTARLLAGDSRNAYLALDTALRLYPKLTPARFFTVCIEERPATEAYTVLAMALRAGIVLPFESVRRVLSALRSGLDHSTLPVYFTTLRQMISLVYLNVGAGGRVANTLVNDMAIAMSQIFRVRGVDGLDAKQRKRLVTATLDIIRKFFSISAYVGAKPTMAAFHSLIVNIGGHGQSKQTIGIALKDAAALGLAPTTVTFRSVLAAFGFLGDASLIEKAWTDLAESKADAGEVLDATDFHILIKAAKLSGHVDYAVDIVERHLKLLPEELRDGIYAHLYASVDHAKPGVSEGSLDVELLHKGMQMIRADLDFFENRIKEFAGVQDFSKQRLSMLALPPPKNVRLPEAEMRRLYDEVTTESIQGEEQDSSLAPANSATEDDIGKVTNKRLMPNILPDSRSATWIPIGTLRYENWKLINYLLSWSEEHNKDYLVAVNRAIAAGVAPPRKDNSMKRSAATAETIGPGLSDDSYENTLDAVAGEDEDSVRKARDEIIRLRGLQVVP